VLVWRVQGDTRLRSNYNDAMVPQLKRPVRDVLDLGCATGMSTLALRAAFPDASITGVDLSPFFLVRGGRDASGESNENERADGRVLEHQTLPPGVCMS
jgi:trans-aconitate methyltransferase